MNGFAHHLLTSLRLNFRNPQALVFGYVVPVFFLFAFGSIFAKSGKNPLGEQLGQLLTISALGGACFGLPITFVSERERGVWRRYRLTPMPTRWFVASMILGRFLIVLSSALLQLALAIWIYKTHPPLHPWQALIAFCFVSFAFLGLGLVICMVANSAGAVQALGQSLFLPMIMIGGIGVPMRMLPKWAQHVAGFLPGRYAVQAMDSCILKAAGLWKSPFNLFALALIGSAGCLAGAKLFRWENDQKFRPASLRWVALAIAAWAAVGLLAEYWHKL
jgi:ABC-2 type transport system permease protein